MTTPPFNPLPCCGADGSGGGADVENNVLCEIDENGNLIGTALAVYEYDAAGNPVGAPVFVDPLTGEPYVVTTGTLQLCPGGQCAPPMQFCQTSTTTGPVEHPGRTYDITLPVNQGFGVDSLVIDAVTHAAGITWSIFDVDGSQFASDLDDFITGRLPAGTTVTVTNPNAGVTELCGPAAPMQIHIECIRLDQTPPNLIELVYNGGEDLVQNPGYNTTPPTDLSQFQFYYLRRADGPAGEFGPVNCTSAANRGWETNDLGPNGQRDFEIWGTGPSGLAAQQNTTPTPRGTPVQEVTADINDTGPGPTIWQTFNVPAPGNFRVQLVHGARDTGEQHTIRLSTGDTNDTGTGDIINDVTTPASVTNSGGPNPWTVLDQTVPLNSGEYTFSFTTTNPVGPNRGGLFTDMRVYVDRPGLRATAVTDDETCVVTTDETATNTVCSYWQPQCSEGRIVGWVKVDTGLVLSNAEFWAQTPTPQCCTAEAPSSGGGGSALSNMIISDVVCAVVGGISRNAIRVVVTDPSGGQLQEQFLGQNGAPLAPDSWTAGTCTSDRTITDMVLCDQGNGNQAFLRKYVQSLSETGQGQINSVRDFQLDGSATYAAVGPVGACFSVVDQEVVCWTQTSTGDAVHTGTMRHDDGLPAPGWLLFDQHQTPVLPTEPGLTFVSCADAMDPVATTGLCLVDGTPIAVVVRRNSVTGAVSQDGWLNLTTGAFTAGAPPVGTIACGDSQSIQVTGVFCDVDGTGDVLGLVLIEYSYNPDGTIASVRLVNATTGATYTPTGTISVCPSGTEQPEQDIEILCDVNAGVPTPFIRDYRRDETGTVVATSDYTLAGAAYTPTGAVGLCSASSDRVDAESAILCDSATTPVRFLRTYQYTAAGTVAGFTDTTLAGAAFTPTGAVGVCATTVATDTDFVEEILCDANGTSFIRLFRFNSTTGALVSTTNTTLAGAAFAPVGVVGLCSDCCPQVIGEGCTNTGSGRYTAVRAANGTVTLIDSVSGATVTAGNIIACPGDDTVRTLSAQARVLTNAAPWTPGGDVTGTLTSLTVTGTSGLWDLVDADGTALTGLPAGLSLTWEAEDDNQLTGPTSVTPQAGATVVANWTSR